MSTPIKHHYNPEFYLSRWIGDDERLCQFSKPRDEIVPNRRYPSQTGFQKRLYEMADQPPELAQQVESRFMQPLDTQAAEALAALEADDPIMTRDARLRSGWSRFIMSMMMRGPEAIQGLKRGTAAQWEKSMPELEAKYALVRSAGHPATLREYLAQTGDSTDGLAMSLVPHLIDHKKIVDLLNNMRWFIRRIVSDEGEFLTSDRPVLMSWTLTEEHAYLFLPLGPKAMFAAVNDIKTQRIVEERAPVEQVRSWNQLLAGRAQRYVYAQDDSMLAFVAEHFGKHRRATPFEQLADRYSS